MSLLHEALEKSARTFKFSFDEKAYTIRRNLMVSSSIVVGATFVSPPANGIYEINLGIIKGNLEKPELVWIFLAVICIYYLIWFYIHCRSSAVKSYCDIKHQFMSYLAALRVREIYRTIYEADPASLPKPRNYDPAGGGGDEGVWRVDARWTLDVPKKYAAGIEKLKLNKFGFQEYGGELRYWYNYEASDEDLKYLSSYLDLYWRGRFSHLFTTILPIVYATFALLLLARHIYVQIG